MHSERGEGTMKIILNNNPDELSFTEMTVQELLTVKKFSFRMLIIKINDKLVKRDDYDTSVIHDGDKVDVIHLISGG